MLRSAACFVTAAVVTGILTVGCSTSRGLPGQRQGGAVGSSEVKPEVGSLPPGSPSDETDVQLIAKRFIAAYEGVTALSFEETVVQEGMKAGGEVYPSHEVAWVRTHMVPGKIRTDVYRGRGKEHWLTYVDDGTTVAEMTADGQIQYTLPDRGAGRSLRLADSVDFDGCLVGHLLRSWLGADERQVHRYGMHISSGDWRGTALVDGHECHVVYAQFGSHAPGALLTEHWLYVDRESYWLRERRVKQTAFTESGEVYQIVIRTDLFQNIRTDPVDPNVFGVDLEDLSSPTSADGEGGPPSD